VVRAFVAPTLQSCALGSISKEHSGGEKRPRSQRFAKRPCGKRSRQKASSTMDLNHETSPRIERIEAEAAGTMAAGHSKARELSQRTWIRGTSKRGPLPSKVCSPTPTTADLGSVCPSPLSHSRTQLDPGWSYTERPHHWSAGPSHRWAMRVRCNTVISRKRLLSKQPFSSKQLPEVPSDSSPVQRRAGKLVSRFLHEVISRISDPTQRSDLRETLRSLRSPNKTSPFLSLGLCLSLRDRALQLTV